MRRRFRQRQLQPLGEILSRSLKRRGLAARLEESRLFKLWPEAVGPAIAAQSKPDAIRGGIMFVRTTSSVWVQQLHFMKDEIRRKINELSGKTWVIDIHFGVGYIPDAHALKNAAGLGAGKTALKERDKKMIAQCTDALADRELAEILKRVMKKEITRRRFLQAKTGH
ncbi:MAG: DUF721 domain-containing protein [Smithella sp.]|nr:DUF721 domain-containing protein [Smithella sp.]